MKKLALSGIVLVALGCSGGADGESNPGALPDGGTSTTDAASDVAPEASPGNLGDSCQLAKDCKGLAAALGSHHVPTCSWPDSCSFNCAGEADAEGLTDAANTCEELGGHCQVEFEDFHRFVCVPGPDPGAPYPILGGGTYSQCLPGLSTITCDEICGDFGKSCTGVHFGPSCVGGFADGANYPGSFGGAPLKELQAPETFPFARCECST